MLVNCNPLLADPSAEFTVRIFSSGDALCGNEWQANEPSPPYSRLYYIAEGSGTVICKQGKIALTAGKLYLLPSGFPFFHSCEHSMRQIYFHIDLVNRGGYDLLRSVDRVLSLDIDSADLKRLEALYSSQQTVDIMQLRTLLLRHITTMLSQSRISLERATYSDCVSRAIEIITDRPRISLSVAEIAEQCFVSPDTLAHRFKKEVGVSVGKYIDELVMFAAEQMLQSTDLPLSKISSTLEFCDQFYFSRRFKQHRGISPQSYRSQHKG